MHRWARGITDNVVGNLIASVVIAGGLAGLGWAVSLPSKDVALVAVGAFAIGLLALTWAAVRTASASEDIGQTPILQIEQRLKAMSADIGRRFDALDTRLTSLSGSVEPPARAAVPEEIIDKEAPGMFWAWNKITQEAAGPFCARHDGQRLVLQVAHSRKIEHDYSESTFLGTSYWFYCEEDRQEFPILRLVRIGDKRKEIANQFRTRFHLPPIPEPPPTPEQLQRIQEISKLFRPGQPPQASETDK